MCHASCDSLAGQTGIQEHTAPKTGCAPRSAHPHRRQPARVMERGQAHWSSRERGSQAFLQASKEKGCCVQEVLKEGDNGTHLFSRKYLIALAVGTALTSRAAFTMQMPLWQCLPRDKGGAARAEAVFAMEVFALRPWGDLTMELSERPCCGHCLKRSRAVLAMDRYQHHKKHKKAWEENKEVYTQMGPEMGPCSTRAKRTNTHPNT
eukprot:1157345-Pelagomonas_calceolata.AAC.5